MSIIVKAAREFVKDTPHPDIIHLTVYFLRACNVGEGEVRIQSVRKSKAFHNLSASLIQAVRPLTSDGFLPSSFPDQTLKPFHAQGDVRVSADMLFGTLSEPHLDATIAPPLTLTPSSSMYRRTPVHEHPATCSMYPLPKFWKFASSTRNGVDMRYVQRNLQKFASKKNDGEDLDMNGVLEVGALLQLVHPNDVVCAETLPIFADMTVPVRTKTTKSIICADGCCYRSHQCSFRDNWKAQRASRASHLMMKLTSRHAQMVANDDVLDGIQAPDPARGILLNQLRRHVLAQSLCVCRPVRGSHGDMDGTTRRHR